VIARGGVPVAQDRGYSLLVSSLRPLSIVAALLPLASALACAAGGTPAATDEAPRHLPSWVPATPPAPARLTRPDRRFVPSASECTPPGRYQVDRPDDRVPSLLVVAGDGPRTLVVALHGGGGDAKKILRQTRFDALAEQEGAMAVLVPHAAELAGRGPRWNTGKFTSVVGDDAGRDDVAYLDGLVDHVAASVCAEEVLVVGFSNGGQMAHRWACQGRHPDAVLTSAGALLVDPATCQRPVALRSYVGKDDRVFREPPLEGSDQPTVPQSAELWAAHNRCDPQPVFLEDEARRCAAWRGCAAPVTLCAVKHFPHGWPAPWSKKKPSSVDATAEGWGWFVELSKDTPPG